MKRNKPRKARNLEVLSMITGRKGGPHRDRRDKRSSNPKNSTWE